SMRLLLVSTVFILVFLMISIVVTHQTLEHINQFRHQLAVLKDLVNSARWPEAKEHAARLQQEWNQVQDYWDLYIFHNDIENIEIALARLVSFIDSRDMASGLAELAALDMHFSHVYRTEMFNFQNVL
ncbi:MAG TPA: DUF4363 family protein, partial [Limnochordia bacterium]|nr:DUF4363 family protein [Limnochordia bacterium]